MSKGAKTFRYILLVLVIVAGIVLLAIADSGCKATVQCSMGTVDEWGTRSASLYIDDTGSMFAFISGDVTAEFSDGTTWETFVSASRSNQTFVDKDARFLYATLENAKYDNGAMRTAGICLICLGGLLLLLQIVSDRKKKN